MSCQKKYFDHFTLFSSLVFKLYSRNSADEDLEDAIKSIDKFLEGLENTDMEYSKELITYNSHILVHSPADRRRHGPLSDISADGYENQLRLYSKNCLSQNIKVQTIALKELLAIKLDLNEILLERSAKFYSSNLVDISGICNFYKNFINLKLNLIQNIGIGYYKEVQNNGYRFKSVIFTNLHERDYNDCFIKINQKFFVILCICQFNKNGYILAKQIKTNGNLIHSFDGFDFKMNQMHVVDDEFSLDLNVLSSPQSFVAEDHIFLTLEKINCHAMYVECKERTSELTNNTCLKKYLVDLEH